MPSRWFSGLSCSLRPWCMWMRTVNSLTVPAVAVVSNKHLLTLPSQSNSGCRTRSGCFAAVRSVENDAAAASSVSCLAAEPCPSFLKRVVAVRRTKVASVLLLFQRDEEQKYACICRWIRWKSPDQSPARAEEGEPVEVNSTWS